MQCINVNLNLSCQYFIFVRLLCTLSRNHSQLVEVGTQVMIVNHAPHEPGFKLKRRVSCT